MIDGRWITATLVWMSMAALAWPLDLPRVIAVACSGLALALLVATPAPHPTPASNGRRDA